MDPLTNLPPELLLQIITHLPTSSALLPLTQTCTYLRGFIHIHSASICNSFILTSSLYTQAARILGASTSTLSSSGWLLPTHRCVLAAETRIVRDKILFSGCACLGCKQHLRASSLSTSSSEISLPEQDGLARMLCFPTPSSATRTCRANLDADGLIRLSQPGPQFLLFLEKYAWEIVTRWSMNSEESTPTMSDRGDRVEESLSLSQDASTEAEERKKEEQRRVEEEVFSFMVGNYCVRRFLEDVEKNFERINCPEKEDEVVAQPAMKKKPMSEKIKKSFAGLGRCVGKRKEKEPTKGTKPPPRLMFGEIPSDENVPAMTEKKKKPVEPWMKGLVWYYGVSTSVSLTSEDDQLEGKPSLVACVKHVRSGLSRAAMKVRSVWRRRFGRGKMETEVEGMGDFQSLDD